MKLEDIKLDLGLSVAEYFHKNIQPLYKSKHAYITYGEGGERVTDPTKTYTIRKPYYSFSEPLTWCNAGVIVDQIDDVVIIELQSFVKKTLAVFEIDYVDLEKEFSSTPDYDDLAKRIVHGKLGSREI